MTDELDTRLRKFLDGQLPPAEEEEVLAAIAENREARELLRLEFQLGRHLRRDEDEAVAPEGFTERTMAAIAAEERTRLSASEWIERAIDWLVEPWEVAVRPAYMMVAVVLIVGIGLAFPFRSVPPTTSPSDTQQTAVQTVSAQPDLVSARFVYVSNEANSVAVAGDFNNWNPQPLKARSVDGQTVWTATYPVPEGEHQYMYVINGEKWVTDPLASSYRNDGFGHRNAVLSL